MGTAVSIPSIACLVTFENRIYNIEATRIVYCAAMSSFTTGAISGGNPASPAITGTIVHKGRRIRTKGARIINAFSITTVSTVEVLDSASTCRIVFQKSFSKVNVTLVKYSSTLSAFSTWIG